MPLRSVEAATRDDAIAAAREQFGPQTRVVGVRRVRSGGVLGFFATERYVAEVAPEQAVRPPVRTATDPDDEPPADFSSPLASAAPARARATAPARNGAAAWAAEAVRSSDAPPARTSAPTAARAAFSAAARPVPSVMVDDDFVDDHVDDSRVSELAGLLTGRTAEPETPSSSPVAYPRASFPRTAATTAARNDDAGEAPGPVRLGDQRVLPAEPAAPSPFTAALARMVAGDQDVRQAVRAALEQPANRSDGEAEVEPTWPGPLAPADAPVPPPAARQKEETVGDQVIAPPSMSRITEPVEMLDWDAEPVPVPVPVSVPAPDSVRAAAMPAPGSSREEAIAEILRAALAQGHSDEALAGILRKVLAGASPQAALTEPEPAAEFPARRSPAAPVAAVTASSPPAVPAVPAVPAPLPLSVAEFAPTFLAPPVREPAAVVEPVVEPVVAPVVAPAAEFPAPEFPAPEFPAPQVVEFEVDEVEVDEVEGLEDEAAAVDLDDSESPADAPVADEAVVADAVVDAAAEPVAVQQPVLDLPERIAPPQPLIAAPAFPAAPAPRMFFGSMWGESPSQATLWGEVSPPAPAKPAPAPVTAQAVAPEATTDAPIWAEVAPALEETATPLADEVAAAIDEPVAEVEPAGTPDVEELVETAPAVETPAVDEQVEDAEVAELAPVLARTASDPAPLMSFDSTSVMPPLSLLPPLPSSRGSRRGRPPVPPTTSRRADRPVGPAATPPPVERRDVPASELSVETAAPGDTTPAVLGAGEPETSAASTTTPAEPEAPTATEELPAEAPDTRSLATVTRLHAEPLPDTADAPDLFELPDADALPEPAADEPDEAAALTGEDVTGRLVALGLPETVLGHGFADDVATRGTYAALTHALAAALPRAPELPTGAGEVIFVVGPGIETLRAARALATSLRLDVDRVQWASRGELAALAPASSRMTTVEAAIDRRQDAALAGTVTVVAVHAPLRTDAYWMAQMTAIWAPTAVWALVDATRKPEDLESWIGALPQVDAVIVEDTDLSSDPAAVLRRLAAPVGLLDGVKATPHRWASLLCERLESRQA